MMVRTLLSFEGSLAKVRLIAFIQGRRTLRGFKGLDDVASG